MRNRVAHDGARRIRAFAVRAAVAVTLLPVLLVAAGTPAAAVQPGVAEERFISGLAGPVGIAAVVLGAGGLVVGLLRRRRINATRAVPVPIDPPRPAPAEAGARTDTAV